MLPFESSSAVRFRSCCMNFSIALNGFGSHVRDENSASFCRYSA
jgi:hypothetical protein